MLRKAPSLEATEAFLVAARASSFRAAAEAIALSPSAFSRRIQQLEAFVGVSLFDRSGPSIQLTEVGARYLADIEPALESIRRATDDLRDGRRAGKLRLALSHSLAVGWLMPRLADLFARHGIELDLVITRSPHVLRSGAADLALWGGVEQVDDLPAERLIDLDGVLVSAATLADGRSPPRSLDALGEHRMLTTRNPPEIWRRWLSHAGHDGAEPAASKCYDTSHLMYEAAASGLGLTLAVPLLTERFLQDTRLHPCTDVRAPVGMGYSLFYANSELRRRAVTGNLRDWLGAEIDASRAAFDRWWSGERNSQRPSAPRVSATH
jgi:DNA-binding transcriptional LysR family regulator